MKIQTKDKIDTFMEVTLMVTGIVICIGIIFGVFYLIRLGLVNM
jgi:hypothetical protein